MKKTTKKMKILGTQEYLNQSTGEIEKMNVIKMEDRDFNFEKIWIGSILASLEAVGNQKIKVLNTLLQLKNNDNLIITTQRNLCKIAKVGLNTVNETLQILIETNFLKKKQAGVYQINPDVLFNGGNKKRMNILFEYNKTEEENEIKIDTDPDTFLIKNKKGGKNEK